MPQTEDDRSRSRSEIACHSCRKRKIKCGRELPQCTVCQRTAQVCEYPSRVLKPGPKVGSTNRKRRQRREHRDESTPETSPEPTIVLGSRQEHGHIARPHHTPPMSTGEDMLGVRDTTFVPDSDRPTQEDTRNQRPRIDRESTNIQDLSFILHPAHEPATSEKKASPTSSEHQEVVDSAMMARASRALGVNVEMIESMIQIYIANMTAINIFHEPTFIREQLIGIASSAQLYALLASILAFSARFCVSDDGVGCQTPGFNMPTGSQHRPAYFLRLASQFVNEALEECEDETPSLVLLKAAVLLAHGQLTQGVRGKAWRSLGLCVRLAYELNLHLVDAGSPRDFASAKDWVEMEEKRRVWWAIWEMDVFASTIRRCPTAIDWTQNETLLPVNDEHWFQGTPHASCFLEHDLGHRWKALQDCGNHSAKAWFIVINSLMKDAQSISSPRGVPDLIPDGEQRRASKSSRTESHLDTTAEHPQEKLEIISNSVHCFGLALPSSLKYKNQYLSFDGRQPGRSSSSRQQHSDIYSIHIMTQLARLMIHHYDMFSASSRAGYSAQVTSSANGKATSPSLGVRKYFEAADDILQIVNRSGDDHIRYINPFIASTIWLASAVQLVRKEFGERGEKGRRELYASRYEVLHLTYKNCVSFWGIQTAMQQNLEIMESHLEFSRASTSGSSSRPTAGSKSSQIQRTENTMSVGRGNRENLPPGTYLPPMKPPSNLPAPARNNSHTHTTQQQQQQQQRVPIQPTQLAPIPMEPLSPALSALDFMHLPTEAPKIADSRDLLTRHMSGPSPESTDHSNAFHGSEMNGDPMYGLAFGFNVDQWNLELPNGIDEWLSHA